MQNYLVRVYRAHPDDEGSVSGVIEDIESGIQESFHDINELQSLLTRSIMKGQLEIPDLNTREEDAYDNVTVIG